MAGAIEDGAKAYLNRQVKTISFISLCIALILFLMSQAEKVHGSMPIGFLIGAVCSLVAGYIRDAHCSHGKCPNDSGRY